MTEIEIKQKAIEVLSLMRGLTLKEYKEVLRYVDNEVHTNFKI